MNNFQKIRKDRGLSQSQLCKLAGINLRTYQHYELYDNAKLPSLNSDVVLKLCVALKCTVGDLLLSKEAVEYDALTK